MSNQYDIGIEGEATAVRFRPSLAARPGVVLGLSTVPNTVGEPNLVFAVGHNRVGSSGGRENLTRHSWHIGLEREFLTEGGGNRQCEWYTQYVSADGSATVRPINAHVDIATDHGFATFSVEAITAVESDSSHQFLRLTKQGQLRCFSANADAFIGVHVDDATETFPTTGQIRLSKDCNIVGSRSGASQTFTQLTSAPNMILGSVGNTCGMFIDAGAARTISLRPDGAAATFTFASTRFTCSSPLRLPTYTVAELPTGAVRDVVYCSNGDAGSPCLAVHDGTSWKRVVLGAAVSTT